MDIGAKLIVGIVRNYDYPDLLRQSKNGSGEWDNLIFVDLQQTPQKKVDVLLVLNHSKENIELIVRNGGKILLVQEPAYSENGYLKLIGRHMDLVISDFNDIESAKSLSIPAGLPWHINKSYQELVNLEFNDKKMDRVSWITSSLGTFSGHKLRLQFIDFLNENKFDFDLFGRGFNPIEDKFDGIYPYKYSIAAENYIAKNYFTEKVIDVFLSGAIPLYYGCTNLEDYFPSNSFVKLDLERPKWSMDKIKEAVDGNFYDANLNGIREARDRILNEYQMFPFVKRLISEELSLKSQYKLFKLRPDGLTKIEVLKKKLRSFK